MVEIAARPLTELYQPAKTYGADSNDGYVRALIRSENGVCTSSGGNTPGALIRRWTTC